MANGILVPVVDFTGMAEDEFNDWYDLEHIPERLRVPGFLASERWLGADNQKISVATYELDNAGVLRSPAYDAVGNHAQGGANLSVWSKRVTARIKMLMRFEGEQIAIDHRDLQRAIIRILKELAWMLRALVPIHAPRQYPEIA